MIRPYGPKKFGSRWTESIQIHDGRYQSALPIRILQKPFHYILLSEIAEPKNVLTTGFRVTGHGQRYMRSTRP